MDEIRKEGNYHELTLSILETLEEVVICEQIGD